MDLARIPTTPLERALRYRDAGDNRAAEAEYLMALESDPQHARVYNELGFIYGQRNQLEQAITLYKTGLRYSPNNPVLLKNLGFMYYNQRDFQNARKTWTKALKVAPGDEALGQALKNLPTG